MEPDDLQTLRKSPDLVPVPREINLPSYTKTSCEVFMVVTAKYVVFWNMTLYGSVCGYRRFG
jgi:hypothetical protein